MLIVLCILRLLAQCTEYFDLRCQLLDDLTSKSRKMLSVCMCAYMRQKEIDG